MGLIPQCTPWQGIKNTGRRILFSFFSLEGAINVKALSKDIIGSPKRAHKSYLEQKREEEVEKLMLKIKKAEKMEIAIKQQKMKKKFWRGISNSKAIKLFFKKIEWCYTKRDMKLMHWNEQRNMRCKTEFEFAIEIEIVIEFELIYQDSVKDCVWKILNACKKTSLHKKWSFLLRISSVNVSKSTGNCGFGLIFGRNP